MKTVTEFSGIVLREAAQVRLAFRPQKPQHAAGPSPNGGEAAAEPPAEAAASGEPGDAAAPAETGAEAVAESADGGEATEAAAQPEGEPTEAEAAPGDEAPAGEEAAVEAAPVEGEAAAGEGGAGEGGSAVEAAAEPDPGVAQAAAELETKMGITGDRLARLMEALDVIRDRADNVRLIRVMSGEDPPPAAKKQGDFYYLVDLMPRAEPRRDRGRPGGGRGRDDRGGG
ncbi:MAG TPA: hypothetical protein VHH90_06995, partial [Polyangia bacterium]|nr:hypothetical protein [Polyangia bacterium]